jgi:hypothetical protein
MKKRTRSILKELEAILPQQNRQAIIESRASHIIESAINLLNQIYTAYGPDEALELEKRFLSSLKNRDPKRFDRGMKKFKDSGKTDGQ